MAKKPAPKELTSEERIQATYDKEVASRRLMSENIPEVTEGFGLELGDSVEVGNLDDCVVVGLFEDGKFVVVEHTRTDNNYGKPIRTEGCIGCWAWTEVFAIERITKADVVNRNVLTLNFSNSDLSSVMWQASKAQSSPDYQRGYIWTLEDKQKYIDSVFEQRSLGAFIFVKDAHYNYEILDGKQRSNALQEYVAGKFSYKDIYFREMSRLDRYSFMSRSVQWATVEKERLTKANLLKIFLDVNCAGVPQTEEHLAKIRKMYEDELVKENGNG